MYETHFGLKRRPFSLSPDTDLFVNLTDHEQCFELLIHVLEHGEGFLKVVGDVGIGKTILCRKLLGYLKNKNNRLFYPVYIPNPMLSPIGLYRAVGMELGLTSRQKNDNDTLLHHINERILKLAESDKSVVIVIDEAQSLPPETLEALRLISNLETEQKKLVQIILFGQTELDALLDQKRFRQLRQRITFSHYLKPLSTDEMQRYIEFRLLQSGYNGPALFTRKAFSALYKSSKGVPRMINVLAHKALLAAFSDQTRQVDKKHIIRAADAGQASTTMPNYATMFVIFSVMLFAGAIAWRFL
jgi:MSHA biogenesis protein MshM